MTCTDCENHIVKALSELGAVRPSADFRRNEAVFTAPSELSLDRLFKAVRDAGYVPVGVELREERCVEPPQSQVREYDYDLLIIGSGAAAFSAAIEAVKFDARIAIIERSTVGGTCVNVGCVPSKTMLRAGEIYHQAGSHPFAGIHTSVRSVDLSALIDQKDALVQELRKHKYEDLIDAYGFKLLHGEARFADGHTVIVNEQRITAAKFLIATGASPEIPDIEGLTDVSYLTSTSALDLRAVPDHLIVIGSGFIALEMGQFFRDAGARVTLIQRSERLLPSHEPEISDAVRQFLQSQGIDVICSATYERISEVDGIKSVHLVVQGEARVIRGDALLVAAGRAPNTAGLDLEKANVRIGEKGQVLVVDGMRTSNPDVYAAGDVTLGPQFVYVAAHQGAIAASNAVGKEGRKVDLRAVPSVIFTHPAIASVGMTEEKAKAHGHDTRVSVVPLDAVPRALANHDTTGVLKLVADAKTRKILGVHVVAENAGDVIYSGVLAIKFGLTIDDIAGTLAPYLTMAEGLKLAALTFDRDVSTLSCCAG
ncbi:mercury(II) reductase [Ferroacidibacillus organovorans]|uniref:Mercuric reductase n=1 Tax=Ferroacidibacillus organovorans TaxID=1765683 RepID=A0A101XNB7_9BACL|nr:mercury(II) reductase [Ferroacidibacillus organovorans]KUO94605.1 mercuric reductase [Ferroacidibacillus organovorans]